MKNSLPIKKIPLSRLEADLKRTLTECADSEAPVLVELPDRRLLAIQAFEPVDDDSLVNDLLECNPAFRDLLAKSKASPRKPFFPDADE